MTDPHRNDEPGVLAPNPNDSLYDRLEQLEAENERLRKEVRRMFRNGKTVVTTQRTVTVQICCTREFLAALEGKDE